MKSQAPTVAPNADINLWHDTESFFHRGTSGQWQDVFSEDDLHAYDRRVAELASPDLAHWLHNGWLRLPQPATSVECDEASLIPAE